MKSLTYRNTTRKSLALNLKFQNKTFPAVGILANSVHHQGLGAMDLVANVMLGNSTAATSGKPAGKTAGGEFAALLPNHEAIAGGADQSGPSKGATGNKKGLSAAKESELASQLAALNIPVFLPQAPPLAAAKTAPAEIGDAVSKADGCGKDTAQAAVGQLRVANAIDLNVGAPRNVAKENESATQAITDDNLPKSGAEPETESPRASQSLFSADKAAHSNPNSEIISRLATRLPAETKQVEKPEVTQQKPALPVDNKIQGLVPPQDGVASAAAKTVHAVESLASSAVKIALKQTLPAQSKLANVSTTAALPNARAFAASQTAEGHGLQSKSIHPASSAHESQPAHDQSKKETEVAASVMQSGVDTQTRDQVNAAGRVVSSTLNTENPKQSTGPAIATSDATPLKPDFSAHEAPVAVSSPLSLHSARLLESLGQSELRVGMKMGDLGNVEIRTQLHHDQLRAEISVERGDLGRTLAAEMPAVQQKLRDHDIPLASIVVNHQAAAGSGSFERGSQQQQQMTTPMAHVFGVDPMIFSSSPEEPRVTDSALDVRI